MSLRSCASMHLLTLGCLAYLTHTHTRTGMCLKRSVWGTTEYKTPRFFSNRWIGRRTKHAGCFWLAGSQDLEKGIVIPRRTQTDTRTAHVIARKTIDKSRPVGKYVATNFTVERLLDVA